MCLLILCGFLWVYFLFSFDSDTERRGIVVSPVTREVTVMLRESSLIDSVPCILELRESEGIWQVILSSFSCLWLEKELVMREGT